MKLSNLRKMVAVPVLALMLALSAGSAAFAAENEESSSTDYAPPTQEEIDEMWATVDELCDEQLGYRNDKGVNALSVAQKAATKAGRVGTYPRSKGSILVTKDAYKNLIPTGHAAIVYSKDVVIEALAQGVVKGRNNWNMSKKTCYGAKVVAASTAKQQKAANWAYKQIGKKYNYNFADINTTKKFYCSQLVWAAYRNAAIIDICPKKVAGRAIYPPDLIKSLKTTQIVYRH